MNGVETAEVDRVARVRELERFALARLPSLQLGDGVFCHHVEAGEPRPQGRSLRYTLIVLLGLLRAEEHGLETGFHLGALRSRLLSELGSEELSSGDMGLALWAESRAGGDAAPELVAALRSRLDEGGLDGVISMEVAWIVIGLTEAGARGVASAAASRSSPPRASSSSPRGAATAVWSLTSTAGAGAACRTSPTRSTRCLRSASWPGSATTARPATPPARSATSCLRTRCPTAPGHGSTTLCAGPSSSPTSSTRSTRTRWR